MAAAEGGSVPNGVGYGDECPLSSRLRGLGERRELPQGVRGRAPAKNGFWCILKATERSFLYLYDKNLRGTICTSVPLLQILGGTCPPRPPVIYAHACHYNRRGSVFFGSPCSVYSSSYNNHYKSSHRC